jgi:hypothetical protein
LENVSGLGVFIPNRDEVQHPACVFRMGIGIEAGFLEIPSAPFLIDSHHAVLLRSASIQPSQMPHSERRLVDSGIAAGCLARLPVHAAASSDTTSDHVHIGLSAEAPTWASENIPPRNMRKNQVGVQYAFAKSNCRRSGLHHRQLFGKSLAMGL